MMQEEISTNQTQFAQEEPLFQNPDVPVDPRLVAEAELDTHKKKPKLPFIVAGVMVFFLLLVGILVLMQPKEVVMEVVEPSPSPSPVLAANDPLLVRVQNLQLELDAADPTGQTLVFPPIDMEITLDKIKR